MMLSWSRKLPSEAPSKAISGRIAVLVADDTPMGCQLLKNALRRSRHAFDVVACAVTCADVLNSVNLRSIDVALIGEDLEDGRLMGFQVLRELHVSHPETKIIILCNSPQNDLVVDAFRTGARGVFCRAEPFESLCKCIKAVHTGQVWANSTQLQLILGALVKAAPLRVVSANGLSLLAKRETEVVGLVAEGLTNREIAVKLGLSEHTISNYLFRIYNKLGISSRVELVLYVMRQREGGQQVGHLD